MFIVRVSALARILGPALALVLTACLAIAVSSGSAAEGECFSAPNPVKCENALPGAAPSTWQVEGIGDTSIQGYATSMSVNAGEAESFKVSTPASSYHIDILRLGYYHGDGARLIASNIKPSAKLPQTQPECLKEASTGLIDCGNWGVSASWTVPANAVSGVYVAHLVRNDTGGSSQIPFVVRNDASHSEIVLQTSDATWEAYNAYGGNSLYTCTVSCPEGRPKAYKAAYAVSYNRPFDGSFTTDRGGSYLYYAEYQMLYWLEENGYNVSYISDSQVDKNGALLKNHKVFVSSGHDEYWSAGQRASVEAAREAGVNLAFFSANEIFWKTRWGASIDGSSTAYRTLTSYKETHFEGPVDPKDPPTWTGAWTDPRGGPADDGGNPMNALSGQQFVVNSGTSAVTVPSNYGKLRMWRNTSAPTLQSGQSLTLNPGTLGYEWDEDLDNGYRPAGEFDLSSTTVEGLQSFYDYGTNVSSETTGTHHLTLYKAKSGALVFGAGTVQWSWGLANVNAWEAGGTDPGETPPNTNMEQFTVNLLAEMGAQPTTLVSGLQTASKSTDTVAPSSTISSPAAGATLQDGSSVTISGTATDTGGGVVAGVEVSTDNGSTWHPATLTTPDGLTVSWSYTWVANGSPSTTIRSRAVDDSANLETPKPGTSVKVSCPCSLWGNAITPTTADSGDAHAVTVGVKFTTEIAGTITGIRFYKSAANTGTHVGDLWNANGTLLASATFTGETATGWQQVNFSTPVAISPNATYVAGYFAPAGHYAETEYFFLLPSPSKWNVLNSPPLHAVPANAAASEGSFGSANGMYSYGASSTFPVNSESGTNYWVDPVFTTTESSKAPGQVTGVTATAGPASASVSWNAPGTGGAVAEYKITPFIGTQAQTAITLTGAPPATTTTISGLKTGTSYTFTVQALNSSGAGTVSAASNAVTPTTAGTPSAPGNVTAAAATRQALASWSEPTSNGGSPITSYKITPYIGTTAQAVTEAPAGSTSMTVKGLTNGTAYTFTVTAVNATGTGGASSPSAAVIPQDTIFDFATPEVAAEKDSSSVELGVDFNSEVAGTITGIRFYKGAGNTGTHVGSLWSASGTLLASATFTGETASGWQQVNFSTPVAISPNTTYVAGYLAPKGHYAATLAGLATSPFNNLPLSALANTTTPNGVYAYNAASTFPTNSYKATNYFVDVDFEPAPAIPPGQVTGVTATAGPASASVSWNAPGTGGAVSEYKITPFIGTQAQTAITLTGAPPATTTIVSGLKTGTSYTFTVQALNGNGAGTVSAASNAVTPTGASSPSAPSNVAASAATRQVLVSWSEPTSNGGSPITSYKITPYIGTTAQAVTEAPAGSTSMIVKGLTNGSSYTFTVAAANGAGTGGASSPSAAVIPEDTIFDFATPAIASENDSSSVELGVKFSSEVAGTITGIRFYKGAGNTGTHVGSLWSSSGTLLASATFTGETASGWQQVNFSTPVAISASTTYVAGYLAPKGHYAATGSAFATSPFNNLPLSAPVTTTTPNGVYAYNAASTFPTNSYKATNYFVDVDFEPSH